MRQKVSEDRMSRVFNRSKEKVKSLEDIAQHFVHLKERVRMRLLMKANITHEAWENMSPKEKEEFE